MTAGLKCISEVLEDYTETIAPAPARLPVRRLSLSSIGLLRKCPMKWKRKYLDHDYEPSTGKMVLGKCFGAAEAQSDHTWIESGEPLPTEDTLDAFAGEFDLAASEDVDWQGNSPGELKDSGALALRIYHTQVPGLPAPIDAEREISLVIEDVPFVSYLDVEREDGSVEDRKLTAKKLSQDAADQDPQASAYLAGRRAEGNPAERFVFDTAVRTKQPYSERVETSRTEEQLDHFLLSVLGAAEEIEWRTNTGNWAFAAPGAWWCSESQCGYWGSCPAGGLLRRRAAAAVRNGGGNGH